RYDRTTSSKTQSQTTNRHITNWAQDCGISTYAQFLVNAIRPLAEAVRVFSEFPIDKPSATAPYDDGDITYCWSRGTSMLPCTTRLLAWEPDFIVIQHEFGIFPKAPYILQLL